MTASQAKGVCNVICLKTCLTASLLLFILKIDREEAHRHWGKPCPWCRQGTLCWARRSRKPRLPKGLSLPEGFEMSDGLCCSAEGCRKRFNPVSVRFAGRSPYPNAIFLLARLFAAGPSTKRLAEIRACLEVDERTLRRWLAKWRGIEEGTPRWRNLSAKLMLAGKSLHDVWEKVLSAANGQEQAFTRLVVLCQGIWEIHVK